DSVNRRATAKSKMVRNISAEHAVDIRSLSDSVQALNRIIESFAETISAPAARVTLVVKNNARSLKAASKRVVAAGANARRVAIVGLNRGIPSDAPIEQTQRAPLQLQAASSENGYTLVQDQDHLLDILRLKGNLRACDLSGVRVHGIDLTNIDLSG